MVESLVSILLPGNRVFGNKVIRLLKKSGHLRILAVKLYWNEMLAQYVNSPPF
jgi:hypothetical protein